MLERDLQTGKLLPAPIKVGDVVVSLNDVPTDLSGFKPNKGYKVIATSRSKLENKRTENGLICHLPDHFIIVDEWGNKRRQRLDKTPFGWWEKVKS